MKGVMSMLLMHLGGVNTCYLMLLCDSEILYFYAYKFFILLTNVSPVGHHCTMQPLLPSFSVY